MEQVVRDSHPPQALLNVFNPIMRSVVSSPLGRRIQPLAVLEFTGRRTGKRYRVLVGWHEVDGRAFVVTAEKWRLNFEGGAPLSVTHGGRVTHGRGRLMSDPAETTSMLNRLQDNGTKLRELGMAGPEGCRLTEADVVALRRTLIYFEPTT
jgi:hypothetical protein